MMNLWNNYDLNIRVVNVQPVGDQAALVRTRILETKSLNPRGGPEAQMQQQGQMTTGRQYSEDDQLQADNQQRFGRDQQGRSMGGTVNLATEAICTHLLQRTPESGRIQIVMGICDAETGTGQ
jgi:hypothetical protein